MFCNMLRQIKFYCVIFLLTSNVIDAQVTVSLEKGQALLSQLFTDAAVKKTDVEKEKVHDSIAIVLHAALQDTGSFDFPFKDVKNLGKVYSDDKKIRFYTWNHPYADGTSRYYGFVQYKPEKGAPVYVYRLTDESNTINDATSAVTHPENWYGCLVYEITSYRQDKQYYYILLGYDPHNLFISRRVIDIMYSMNLAMFFGKPYLT